MKEKCIIFGCGAIGKKAYYKLCQIYDIIAYADNNSDLWGKEIEGKEIVSAEKVKDMYDAMKVTVVVAVNAYHSICRQLKELGIDSIVVWRFSLLLKCSDLSYLYPMPYQNDSYIIKEKQKMSILFVQTAPCIRTNKIAKALADNGVQVSLAYSENVGQANKGDYEGIYKDFYPICSMEGLIDFVNKSEIDVVHSSNEPDFLTALAVQGNKPVIHDCHDLSSAYKSMKPDEMTMEFLANVRSAGVIYTTEGIRDIACKKFHMRKDKTYVLENLISEELQPTQKKEKLRDMDGKIHCVYEGGIIENDETSHRFFEHIWKKITDAGVHIHYYSPSNEKYCQYLETKSEFLHYEGNISSKELSIEMSKYDVGLCLLNINDKNKQYLEYASPNKIQEYVNAGIPVAVGDIQSQINFVGDNNFGNRLDLSSDIIKQLEDIAKIDIPENILIKKGLTLESKIPELILFYQKCMGK